MFPDVGLSEMALIGLLALLVVGPKDLPLMMRKVGRFMNKIRMMASEFRASFDDLARQAELDELRKEVEALRTGDAVRDIQAELSKPAMPPMPPASPELLAKKQAILAKETAQAEPVVASAGAPLVESVSQNPMASVVEPAKPKRRTKAVAIAASTPSEPKTKKPRASTAKATS
jgi:sec-independent protein translocase protein TatB